jgi:2'-5' RNA ligase
MVRSFIAVDLTDENVLRSVAEAQSSLKACKADLKIVDPSNLHFTLKFLGELSMKEVESVKSVLAEVEFKPFQITLRDVGAFPNLKFMRVVWVGVSMGEKDLVTIADSIEEKLRGLGFPAERRRFSPHLTIARVKSQRGHENLLKTIEALRERLFGTQEVSEVKLKKSELTPKGPIYSNIYVCKAQT